MISNTDDSLPTSMATPIITPEGSYTSSTMSMLKHEPIYLLELSYMQWHYQFSITQDLHLLASGIKARYLQGLEEDLNPPPTCLLGLVIDFIGFASIVTSEDFHLQEFPETILENNFQTLLNLLLYQLEKDFLSDDIHQLLAESGCDAQSQVRLVDSYYKSYYFAQRTPSPSLSALLQSTLAGQTKIYAVLGGQGITTEYFQELRTNYNTYKCYLEAYLPELCTRLKILAMESALAPLYPHGLDTLRWLQQPETTPDLDYLNTAPVSMPLIGILQLAHYYTTLRILGKLPFEFCEHLSGIAAHSQGCVIAAVIAAADSWDSFFKFSLSAVEILFWIGARSQATWVQAPLPLRIVEDSIRQNEGVPSPMLSIRNVSQIFLQSHIDTVNKFQPDSQKMAISLMNGPRSFVVVGPPLTLYKLRLSLSQETASHDANQSQVPHCQRKAVILARFLPITAPFHSKFLVTGTTQLLQDLQHITIPRSMLQIPFFDAETGDDISTSTTEPENIVPRLVRSITLNPVFWEKATAFPNATHILDFGPGADSSIGLVTSQNKEGSGVHVILASTIAAISSEVGYKSELLSRHSSSIVRVTSWAEEFGPRLFRYGVNGGDKTIIDTRFSRLLKVPPIMVAGMTPTTTHWDVVTAAMNAGYHIELACGGYTSEAKLRTAISNISQSIRPGRGIALNVIFANAHSIAWQIPLIVKLRVEGVCIDGLTIGGGVPSLETTQGYIDDLGLKYISFKPGSVQSIKDVILIAQNNPTFPVILQWTGGRAGGHHSCEDFHEPVLEMYGRIRACKNIVLVAGSGFADANGAYPYLVGTWSRTFGYASMPFDAILFGSRMMTVKEAHTSIATKKYIATVEGLDNKDWEQTFEGPAGGFITVISEMGEPIHMLATAAVRLWAEMDKIFKLPPQQQMEELERQKSYIIGRLNADYHRVWFGQNSAGQVVELSEMTYYDVLRRLLDLTYINSKSRWIDDSFFSLVMDLLQRVVERFLDERRWLQCKASLAHDPYSTLSALAKECIQIQEQLLDGADLHYFLYLCQRPGQKPVPFIPVIDESFKTYFKKDSLWQSEDLSSVPGQDVQRVCILYGPVAAKNWTSKNINEPIGEILDDVNECFLASLRRDLYNNMVERVPTQGYCGYSFRRCLDTSIDVSSTINPLVVIDTLDSIVFGLPVSADRALPTFDTWIEALAGPEYSWRNALFTTEFIISGNRREINPIRRLCEPTHGLSVAITNRQNASKMNITIRSIIDHKDLVNIRQSSNNQLLVTWVLADDLAPSAHPEELILRLQYHPETLYAPLTEDPISRVNAISDFYRRLWFQEEVLDIDSHLDDEFDGGTVEITSKAIHSFKKATTIGPESYRCMPSTTYSEVEEVPMHFLMVTAWRAITKPLLQRKLNGDLLKLLHVSNTFKMVGASRLKVGDFVSSFSTITAILIKDSGKVVRVQAIISRDGNPVAEVVSEFLFRGKFSSLDDTFERRIENPVEVHLRDEKDFAILKSKAWFLPKAEHKASLIGKTLVFHPVTLIRYVGNDLINSMFVTGKIVLKAEAMIVEPQQVGSISYRAGDSSGNPVLHYLCKHGFQVDGAKALKSPIPVHGTTAYLVERASSSLAYAKASGDFNPIHTSKPFAMAANFVTPITHGMHTSAMIANLVESVIPGTLCFFTASFVGTSRTTDQIAVEIWLEEMRNGRKVCSVKATTETTGEPVLNGRVEIEPSNVAYLFTGQGSQKVNMGMELYATSDVARSVWDTADAFFIENYGFRITDIIRNNPKELTIYFGGTYGRKLRQNYMAMCLENVEGEGSTMCKKVFPEITEDTTSYTFRYPGGLLHSTQFTQPAITLVELAMHKDMKSKGLIPATACFAGHSLGEFPAIVAMAEVMSLDQLVALLFFRGMTMQAAVTRNEDGISEYLMCAVNPSRISPHLTHTTLLFIVDCIAREMGMLLEIVNYNITGRQYVCAGELRALDCLSQVLVSLQSQAHQVLLNEESSQAHLLSIIQMHTQSCKEKPAIIAIERSMGLIPLHGIDTPFHSTKLRFGIPSFRKLLRSVIDRERLDPERLIGKWIPNLTGTPFSVGREYVEQVFNITGSQILGVMLRDWGN